MLPRFFNSEIAVANWGESGESLRGYIGENRLAKLMSAIKRGDWLFIQMGHNDQKERGEGVGAFTTYKADLERFISEARAHGANPVLVTPVHRLRLDAAGKVVNSLGDYPEAVRLTAREQRLPLIDLNAMSAVFYEAIGPAELPKAFADGDTTHHNNYGSYELAKCVVEGIRRAKLDLVRYLDAPPFDPAHPDPMAAFQIPAEPRGPLARPYGDGAPQADAGPRLFVIGDSTANNANHRGWADPIAAYFDIPVFNRARAGRSSRTFLTEGLWDKVRPDLKPGDFVLIQFGHNDGGPPDRDRARGSLPGTGDEASEFTMPDGRHETVHTFGWYLRRFIRDAKAAGATPIVLSLTVRNIWQDGKVERGSGRFGEWSADVAREENVAFADVTAAIADTYEQMGEAKVKEFFPEDHTHTTPEGAELNASLIVAALKGIPYSPLADHLSAKGREVKPYPAPAATLPARLGLPVPANPTLPTLFLIGDSTVRNGRADGANGQWGWGEPIVDLFDLARINVVNRAVGGLSSRTWFTQGWWDRTLAYMKPGDFVLIQFGHNDSGPLDDAARARGSLPGTGEETREIDNPLTKAHEVVHTYGWYLRKLVADARSRGATPILCTPIPRKIWKDGKIARDDATFAGWARAVAAAEKVPLVDLNEIIARHYDELGEAQVESAVRRSAHAHQPRRRGVERAQRCRGFETAPEQSARAIPALEQAA